MSEFSAFAGLGGPAELRTVTRAHVIAWRKDLARVPEKGERQLQPIAKELEHAPDFAALHGIVEREVGSVPGIGPLTVYDVAYRVGACLGKAPDIVYIHAGTKVGAAVFGLSGKAIHPNQLPAPFSRLTAAECEDCLCRYKDQLREGLRIGHLKRPSRC